MPEKRVNEGMSGWKGRSSRLEVEIFLFFIEGAKGMGLLLRSVCIGHVYCHLQDFIVINTNIKKSF